MTLRPYGFDPAGKYRIGLRNGDSLVAFADVLVGYPAPITEDIGLLVVSRDRHGFGLGRVLHETVLSMAADARADRLRLGIVATNAVGAEPFCRALGYAPTEERKP